MFYEWYLASSSLNKSPFLNAAESILAEETIRLYFLITFDYRWWVKSLLGTDGKHSRLSLNVTPCPNVLLSSNFPPQGANAGCQDRDRPHLICKPASIALPPLLLCHSSALLTVPEKRENNPALLTPQITNSSRHQIGSTPKLPTSSSTALRQKPSPRERLYALLGGGCGNCPA